MAIVKINNMDINEAINLLKETYGENWNHPNTDMPNHKDYSIRMLIGRYYDGLQAKIELQQISR
jgi:hypothetical protein